MKHLLLRLEPVIWLLFGGGMMVGAFLLPAWLLVATLAVPLGIAPDDALSYKRALELMGSLPGRVVMAAAIALPLWAGAHHLRHIAIDFHMMEYYSSDEYLHSLENEPAQTLRRRIKAWWALGNMFYYAAPFFREVFFRPMDLLDPGGKRIREAFKRIQLVGEKPRVARRPFNRFLITLQNLYQNRLTRSTLGWLGTRIMGLRPQVMERLYTDEEARRAQVMSFDAMADEALAAKFA